MPYGTPPNDMAKENPYEQVIGEINRWDSTIRDVLGNMSPLNNQTMVFQSPTAPVSPINTTNTIATSVFLPTAYNDAYDGTCTLSRVLNGPPLPPHTDTGETIDSMMHKVNENLSKPGYARSAYVSDCAYIDKLDQIRCKAAQCISNIRRFPRGDVPDGNVPVQIESTTNQESDNSDCQYVDNQRDWQMEHIQKDCKAERMMRIHAERERSEVLEHYTTSIIAIHKAVDLHHSTIECDCLKLDGMEHQMQLMKQRFQMIHKVVTRWMQSQTRKDGVIGSLCHDEMDGHNRESESEHGQLRSEVRQLDEEVDSVNKSADELRRERDSLKRIVAEVEDKNAKLSIEWKNLNDLAGKYRQKFMQSDAENKRLRESLAKRRNSGPQQEFDDPDELMEENQRLTVELSEMKMKLEGRVVRTDTSVTQLQAAKKQIEDLQNGNGSNAQHTDSKRITELRELLDQEIQKTANTQEELVIEHQKRMSELQNVFLEDARKSEQQLEVMNADRARLASDLEAANNKIHELNDTVSKLEAANREFENMIVRQEADAIKDRQRIQSLEQKLDVSERE